MLGSGRNLEAMVLMAGLPLSGKTHAMITLKLGGQALSNLKTNSTECKSLPRVRVPIGAS